MAKANPELIAAMRRAADRIEKEKNYQWGHMGHCNCGYLAQELTSLKPAEIHRIALQRSGDWNDQCEDYCDNSRMPIDLLISELLSKGLSIEDLMKLEKLSDRFVLSRLPKDQKYLERNNNQHVAIYLNTWANLLEEDYLNNVEIEKFSIELNEREIIEL
ncbi:hypothetical protein HZR84_05210 [Hyphobacterium sp. CCMP332]|nr:hypothetical protein HZR84_05210 [Hyphobacterium sp. CCMP332]